MGGRRWRLDHDPAARPLGCDGRWGHTGADRHRKKGEAVCAACKTSAAHYAREHRRKALRKKALQPCGTPAAAQRHREKGEPVCFKCRVADAEKGRQLRAVQKMRSGVGVPTP
jgi:hypothetical protein